MGDIYFMHLHEITNFVLLYSMYESCRDRCGIIVRIPIEIQINLFGFQLEFGLIYLDYD